MLKSGIMKALIKNQANEMSNKYRAQLDKGEFVVHNLVREPDTSLFVNWEAYLDHDWRTPATPVLI